jgi:hypothetical protein
MSSRMRTSSMGGSPFVPSIDDIAFSFLTIEGLSRKVRRVDWHSGDHELGFMDRWRCHEEDGSFRKGLSKPSERERQRENYLFDSLNKG